VEIKKNEIHVISALGFDLINDIGHQAVAGISGRRQFFSYNSAVAVAARRNNVPHYEGVGSAHTTGGELNKRSFVRLVFTRRDSTWSWRRMIMSSPKISRLTF
jgi:hypothetical protein